jgi:hypothetical protein
MSRADELRRRRKAEVSLDTTSMKVLETTKRILRRDIPVFNVTLGLPKSRKGYGNGVLIVAASSRYTATVMRGECEGVQHIFKRNINLARGRYEAREITTCRKKHTSIYAEI